MDRIIEQLLSPDTNIINQATRDFEEAFKRPEAVEALCTVMTSHQNADVRQYAAVLLRNKLDKLRNYQQVPPTTLTCIKHNLLNAIFAEEKSSVRSAMTYFFGCMLRHEERTDDAWVGGVIQFIVAQCASCEAQTVENATFVMAKLADESPEPFVQRFGAVGELIKAALLSANSSTAVPATVMHNILTTMGALVPVILGNEIAQQTYQEAVPYLLNVLKKFADEAVIAHFTIGLDVLQSMIEHTPMLLNPHLRLLIEFSLGISAGKFYESEIRIKTLICISFLLTEKKKMIVKLKLIEPIITAVFEVMASEPESDDANEFFVESESDTILAAANVVVDVLSVNMPPEKFLPPLLGLLEPALLNSTDDLRRRAAFIVLATISEGCREAICNKYMEAMLNILKQGLNDAASSVRSAALFAVGQFSEQLQPEIGDYANDVLPQLLKYMQDILQAHQLGQQLEEKLVERLFYALQAFCENLNKGLAPFMESLMTMILTLLNSNFPQRWHILVMRLTESAASAYKGSLLPWFQPLIEKLRPLLWQYDRSGRDDLHAQALNTLAETVRNIDQQFRPFAEETVQKCVQWLESSDDPDIRKALFNLFGALASIVGEEMAPVLPIVLNHIERCLDEGSDVPPQLDRTAYEVGGADGKGDVNTLEMELDGISDEESESGEERFIGDNPYLQAKDQAVYTLKEIALSCPNSLLSYGQKFFESVYKLIEHPCMDLRSSSISAAKTLVINWFQQDAASDTAKQAIQILLSKLIEIVYKDSEKDVVVEALYSISCLLTDLENEALPTKPLRDSVASCINDGLKYKYLCQCGGNVDDDSQDEDDSESDKAVIEGAANLLASLGKAVSTAEYVGYFKLLEPLVMKHFKGATASDLQSTRGFLVGVLAECYAPLGTNIASYFTQHFNILIRGAKERNAKTRQNAIFALGELMRAAGDVSYGSFPLVLNTLSDIVANERKRVVVDNIVGALASLILTNANLVPLEHVLPAMFQKLPIVDDEAESNVVIECFSMLFNKMPERMQTHVGAVVSIAIQTIGKVQCEPELVQAIVSLIQKIRSVYPEEYQQALLNPILAPFLTGTQVDQVDGHA